MKLLFKITSFLLIHLLFLSGSQTALADVVAKDTRSPNHVGAKLHLSAPVLLNNYNYQTSFSRFYRLKDNIAHSIRTTDKTVIPSSKKRNISLWLKGLLLGSVVTASLFTGSVIPDLILSLVIALVVHDFTHAWLADKFGDSTASDAGRISLNPLRHIGNDYMPKKVPVNSAILGKNLRWVALGGPLSNFALAGIYFLFHEPVGMAINILAGAWNLLPIKGFDGEKIWLEIPLSAEEKIAAVGKENTPKPAETIKKSDWMAVNEHIPWYREYFFIIAPFLSAPLIYYLISLTGWGEIPLPNTTVHIHIPAIIATIISWVVLCFNLMERWPNLGKKLKKQKGDILTFWELLNPFEQYGLVNIIDTPLKQEVIENKRLRNSLIRVDNRRIYILGYPFRWGNLSYCINYFLDNSHENQKLIPEFINDIVRHDKSTFSTNIHFSDKALNLIEPAIETLKKERQSSKVTYASLQNQNIMPGMILGLITGERFIVLAGPTAKNPQANYILFSVKGDYDLSIDPRKISALGKGDLKINNYFLIQEEEKPQVNSPAPEKQKTTDIFDKIFTAQPALNQSAVNFNIMPAEFISQAI